MLLCLGWKLTFWVSLRSLALSPEQCTSSLLPGTPRSHKTARCLGAAEPLTSRPPLWTAASQLWTVSVPWGNGERQFKLWIQRSPTQFFFQYSEALSEERLQQWSICSSVTSLRGGGGGRRGWIIIVFTVFFPNIKELFHLFCTSKCI